MNPIGRAPSGTLLIEIGKHLVRGQDVGLDGNTIYCDFRPVTLAEVEAHGLRPPRGIGHLNVHDRLSIIAGAEGAVEYANGIVVAIDTESEGKVARVALVQRWTQAELVARTRAAAPVAVAQAEADAA